MRTIILLLIVGFNSILLAQNVGINSTGNAPDASSGLDVNFTDKGLLIPRVNISDLTTEAPVTSPATSLIVYNTNTTTGPGYFYWNGTKWVKLFDGDDGKPWILSGNSGTTAGTDFLGTTDAVDFVLKTNNNERIRVLSAGNVGIGTSSPSALLDVNGASEFNGTMNLVNNNITNVNSLRINDVGDQEGILWTGSAAKIFVSPLNSGNSDGYLRIINDGGIVFEPGHEDTEVLTLTSGGKVGIGTTSPAETLHINGSFRLTDGNQGDGKVLTSDANGTATWETLSTSTYGTNNQAVTGTTDISVSSDASWYDMDQMTITFTPVHNTIYINFNADGQAADYGLYLVRFRILKDGVVVGATAATCEDFDDYYGQVSAWNASLIKPVSVTPGTSTTIKVQWNRSASAGSAAIENNCASSVLFTRTLLIID